MPAGAGHMEHHRHEWHPRRRLRDLKGLHIRLRSLDASSSRSQFLSIALWGLLKQTKEQYQAVCVAVSHQVPADCPTTWIPLDLNGDTRPELLHSIASGCLHIHVYDSHSANAVPAAVHESFESRQIKARGQAKSPLHSEVLTDGANAPDHDSDDDGQYTESKAQNRSDSAHLVGFKRRSAGGQELLPVAFALCTVTNSLVELVPQCTMTEDAVCTEPDAGPKLVWSLSLDLGVLAEETTSMDMAPTAEASLIFEFQNGRRAVWPPPEQGDVDLGSDANALTHVSTPENTDQLGATWRSLFRRGGHAQPPEPITPQEPYASTSSTTTLVRTADVLHSREVVSNPSLSITRPLIPTEVEYSRLEETIHLLSKLQNRRDLIHAQTAMTEHKLHEAISIRQRKQRQQERLAWLKSRLHEVSTEAAEAGRQAKLVQASCKAARRLMRTQNDHLTIACSCLEDIWQHLEGPGASFSVSLRSELSALQRQLVARRCRLVSDVQSIYSIQPRSVPVVEKPDTGFLWHRLEQGWSEVPISKKQRIYSSVQQAPVPSAPADASAGSRPALSTTGSLTDDAESVLDSLSEVSIDASTVRSVARLAIGSLPLESAMARQKSEGLVTVNWHSEQEQENQWTAALGYAVHVVKHVADYLGIPLKYPLVPANSKSAVLCHQDPVREQSSKMTSSQGNLSSAELRPEEDPLYSEKVGQERFQRALLHLNKDVEQLLCSHSLSLSAPDQILQNLHKLLTAGSSAVNPRQLVAPTGNVLQKLQHDGFGHFA